MTVLIERAAFGVDAIDVFRGFGGSSQGMHLTPIDWQRHQGHRGDSFPGELPGRNHTPISTCGGISTNRWRWLVDGLTTAFTRLARD